MSFSAESTLKPSMGLLVGGHAQPFIELELSSPLHLPSQIAVNPLPS